MCYFECCASCPSVSYSQEEELRKSGEAKFAHLSNDLHVLIEVFAPPGEAYSRMSHALEEIKKFLVPVSPRFLLFSTFPFVYRPPTGPRSILGLLLWSKLYSPSLIQQSEPHTLPLKLFFAPCWIIMCNFPAMTQVRFSLLFILLLHLFLDLCLSHYAVFSTPTCKLQFVFLAKSFWMVHVLMWWLNMLSPLNTR